MVNKKNIFSLVVSIITFLALCAGATFAYYTAITSSDPNSIQAETASFSVGLSATGLYTDNYIIPTKDEDILTAFEHECVDSIGNGACYAYTINITNSGSDMILDNTIDFTVNGIKNLSFVVLDSDNNIYGDMTSIGEGGEFPLGDSYELNNLENITFTLLIWLTETGEPQEDDDASGTFSASITVSSNTGNRLTGVISG